jgi:hypothetical protein
MSQDFYLWARELDADFNEALGDFRAAAAKELAHRAAAAELTPPPETQPMPRRRIDITVTISWLIILILTALVFIGAWVVGTHIIQWVTS